MFDHNSINEQISAYEDIINTINKYSHILNFSTDVMVQDLFREHIKRLNISKLFEIMIPNGVGYNDWYRLSEYEFIGLYNYLRTIPYSDNDTQPNNEYLYTISFLSGAYMFGEDYNTTFFNSFFNELKSFNPKFYDTSNNALYFSPDNAKLIHAAFPNILKKYKDQNKIEQNLNRIRKLESELNKLKNTI